MQTEKQPGKLMMLKGLPRSGKSTFAKELVVTAGNWYRVNKDSLRTMLHNDKWTPQNEKITMKAQDAIVRELLKSGKNVVIDDTNLGEYHHARWSNIAKEIGARFEAKVFDCPIETLVDRDINVERKEEQRGRHVIERMALQYKYLTFEDKEVVICDIDGTVADCEHRKTFLQGAKKDWPGFFSKMDEDTFIVSTGKILSEKYHLEKKKIIFVSARPEKYRQMTEDWLLRHNLVPRRSVEARYMQKSIMYDALLMRADGDTREDTKTKQEILDTYLEKAWIDVVVDDRPSVIRMWRENGLEVIDVGPGVEF